MVVKRKDCCNKSRTNCSCSGRLPREGVNSSKRALGSPGGAPDMRGAERLRRGGRSHGRRGDWKAASIAMTKVKCTRAKMEDEGQEVLLFVLPPRRHGAWKGYSCVSSCKCIGVDGRLY